MSNIRDTICINQMQLKNRLIMPPMAKSVCDGEGHVVQKLVDYYQEKSQSGYISMIITEHAYVSKEGKAGKGQMSLEKDSDIEGLKKIVDAIHQNDTKVIAQISHVGIEAKQGITGLEPMGPSSGKILDKDEIAVLVQKFVMAAERALKAGFDGVELHSAHRYLLNQFYSPLTNQREDEYGGSAENRIRIHLEIIREIRNRLDSDFPLLVRLGALDYQEGGSTLEDAVFAAKAFEEAGADAIDISGGMNGYIVKDRAKGQGYYTDVTEKIKEQVHVPVIMTGGITELKDADRIIREGKADLVGVGRAILKDSKWAENGFRSLEE